MISIIIPVVREDRIGKLIQLIHKNAGISADHYEIVTEVDRDRIGCPKMVARLVEQTNHEWVMFLGDDTLPQRDFLKNALRAAERLTDGGLVCLNDGIHKGEFATHWLAHKSLLEHTGGEFFHTGYIHQFCDIELSDIAKEQNCYVYAHDAIIKHDHPFINGEEPDKFHQLATNAKTHLIDRELYHKRRAERTGIKYKLAIALPVTSDNVPLVFFKTFQAMWKPEHVLLFPKFGCHPGDIAHVRNELVREAIYFNCTHILFMDTDQTYNTVDLIPRLFSHEKDIVGGVVHRRWIPFEPIAQRDGEHVPDEELYQNGLVPVDTTGTGCLLINLDVFYNVERPYFELVRNEHGRVMVGEDVYFLRKAKEAGYQAYVDCGVEIGHLATLEIGRDFYEFTKKIKR